MKVTGLITEEELKLQQLKSILERLFEETDDLDSVFIDFKNSKVSAEYTTQLEPTCTCNVTVNID